MNFRAVIRFIADDTVKNFQLCEVVSGCPVLRRRQTMHTHIRLLCLAADAGYI